MDQYTTATLSNGLRVANFSSNHPFKFVDGTELKPCSVDRCKALMLEVEEKEFKRSTTAWTDIRIQFNMNEAVLDALSVAQKDNDIDIVLCPLPVLTALKESDMYTGHIKKARGLRMADRITKEIHIDRFCI